METGRRVKEKLLIEPHRHLVTIVYSSGAKEPRFRSVQAVVLQSSMHLTTNQILVTDRNQGLAVK